MRVWINERPGEVGENACVGAVRDRHKPDADLTIVNGFPVPPQTPLSEGDRLVLIRRGEAPASEELDALLRARHTPGVHERIRNAHVGVAGLGGLGSQVAMALARLGIGALTLVDFDVVEPSNLNRQLYFVPQLGMTKTEALAQTLRAANPYVTLHLHATRVTTENVAELFGDCAVVVEAFDRAQEKAMLVETALRVLPQAAVVAASGLAGYGPADDMRTHRLGPRLYVVGDLTAEARPGMGLMSPRVGVAAHLQANVVLRLLLGEER